jgi:ABC-type nitrate/sulfonate/bicarbonate transport system substrate-binding protein
MLLVAPAHAAEKLRVGKAVAFAWTFTPLDVGIQTGIFAKHGLEIEASDATGDAKLQQALTAGGSHRPVIFITGQGEIRTTW